MFAYRVDIMAANSIRLFSYFGRCDPVLSFYETRVVRGGTLWKVLQYVTNRVV
jgi:hypothetical protein